LYFNDFAICGTVMALAVMHEIPPFRGGYRFEVCKALETLLPVKAELE
jgi:hypothetical protein